MPTLSSKIMSLVWALASLKPLAAKQASATFFSCSAQASSLDAAAGSTRAAAKAMMAIRVIGLSLVDLI